MTNIKSFPTFHKEYTGAIARWAKAEIPSSELRLSVANDSESKEMEDLFDRFFCMNELASLQQAAEEVSTALNQIEYAQIDGAANPKTTAYNFPNQLVRVCIDVEKTVTSLREQEVIIGRHLVDAMGAAGRILLIQDFCEAFSLDLSKVQVEFEKFTETKMFDGNWGFFWALLSGECGDCSTKEDRRSNRFALYDCYLSFLINTRTKSSQWRTQLSQNICSY